MVEAAGADAGGSFRFASNPANMKGKQEQRQGERP
jgi:hypothetical protein